DICARAHLSGANLPAGRFVGGVGELRSSRARRSRVGDRSSVVNDYVVGDAIRQVVRIEPRRDVVASSPVGQECGVGWSASSEDGADRDDGEEDRDWSTSSHRGPSDREKRGTWELRQGFTSPFPNPPSAHYVTVERRPVCSTQRQLGD